MLLITLPPTVPPTVQWKHHINDVNTVPSMVNLNGCSFLNYIQNSDIFVQKIDTNCQSIWLAQYHEPNIKSSSLVVDQMHNSYVLIISHLSFNIIKFDTNGQLIWNYHQETDGTELLSMTVSPSGQLYLIGNLSGCNQVYLFDTKGNIVWKHDYSNLDEVHWCQPASGATDRYNNLYYAYYVKLSGQHPLPESDEIVIYKINDNGIIQWIKRLTVSNLNDIKIKPMLVINSHHEIYLTYQYNQLKDSDSEYEYEAVIAVSKLDNNGNILWLQQYPSFNDILLPSLIIDSLDDLYLTYITEDNGISLMKLSRDGHLLWKGKHVYQNLSLTNSESVEVQINIDLCGNIYLTTIDNGLNLFKLLPTMEYHPTIAVDDHDNIYYAYYTNTSMTQENAPNEYGYDLVIVKKDNKGNTLWQLRDPIFNTLLDSLNPYIVISSSQCYVIYQTAGCVSGGEFYSSYDIVVMKLDTDGHIIWIQQQRVFNTVHPDTSPSADLDASGCLYVAYQSLIRSDPLTYDLVVFKMNSDGQVVWIRRGIDYNHNSYSPCLKCDRNRAILYLSYSYQTIADYTDIMFLKLDLTGQPVNNSRGIPWTAQHDIINTELKNSESCLCIDNQGYLYVCYVTEGGSINGYQQQGQFDLVVGKLNQEGIVIKMTQSHIFNTDMSNQSPSMIYRSGHLYIAYQTTGNISGQVQTGIHDIVIMKLSAVTLDIIWITQSNKINTKMNNTNPCITVDSHGQCYVAYETDGSPAHSHGYGTRVMVCQLYQNGSISWVKR